MKIDILKKKTNIFHYFPSKNLKYSQIFLSETIHAQENGSRGPHFAKSLNSNFLKGLTYSAVFLRQVHYFMVYIAYFTELGLQMCDYAQKRRICRENCNYALDERFHGHVCPRRKPTKSCHPA